MFNEKNSVQDYISDILEKINWTKISVSSLERTENQIMLEKTFSEVIPKLNPEIDWDQSKIDEILYKLLSVIQSVHDVGLIKANEEFAKWIKGDQSMPYGKNGQHKAINLIDFGEDFLKNNKFEFVKEFTVKSLDTGRPDIVLFVNGLPLVVIETKTPVRPSISWLDGASDVYDLYEKIIPELFVPNVFSSATEGKELWYGSVGSPPEELWEPWKKKEGGSLVGFDSLVQSLFDRKTVLEMLQYYTVFSTDPKARKIKMIARYPQYEAVNLITQRVVEGKEKSGLIWHFQGSGKSLLMILAAMRLRNHPKLNNPTVMIVVDRIDLDSQIAGKFTATNVPNTVHADTRKKLEDYLKQGIKKIIITTIHKFGEAEGVLNDRDNIIVLVDEADRSQEGDLGTRMRNALPNAFLFGLTGTPVNKKDRNTFLTFGSDADGPERYLHRYSFEESVEDHTTLPINFEKRLAEVRFNREEFENVYSQIKTGLTNSDEKILSEKAGKLKRFLSHPDMIKKKAKDIVEHYKENILDSGFKAQVVAYDRECCDLYRQAFSELLKSDEYEVVMTVDKGDPIDWKKRYELSKEAQEEIIKRFQNPNDPLKFLIVTSKLLRGFDAPVLQVMYLDKPLKDQGLLQAVCRVNRPYPGKSTGIIVDYIGVFDDITKALTYDYEKLSSVVRNIEELAKKLQEKLDKCLAYFPNVDRTKIGYEGLIDAIKCFERPKSSYLQSAKIKDEFGADFIVLQKYWEILNPTYTSLVQAKDYRWLSDVYNSIQPSTGSGLRVWKRLGPKTIKAINEHVEIIGIQDDLEVLVMDQNLLQTIRDGSRPLNPEGMEIRIIRRLKKLPKNKKFIELGERLEKIREMYQQKLIDDYEWLKRILEIAREVVETEKGKEEESETDHKEALTRIFNQYKTKSTSDDIKNLVTEIDKVVQKIRYPGWQKKFLVQVMK
ncbi:HsdR family type I site-specific deoxyribonuclease [Candidatus Nitrosarchaeum limnium SFB1]|uniref:type I site-specific deoxyribonuclease n=1 Tax=Candidatus Nitrosarchaeum limnium SFB1 TaxID=886738 RepID=F3KMR8_9ARCH|nr:HsdR family type I site-specific deoxyribonuclease [Candidatus Nitrosarchaeum limnium SFB1]